MTKLSKGVQCFRFTTDGRTGLVRISRVTVQSWGKVQATISHLHNGAMAEERIYVAQESSQFVPVADCADPVAEGLNRSAEEARRLAAFLRAHRLGHAAYSQDTILSQIAELETAAPAARFRPGHE